jgi:hypothetical protein
MCQTSIAKTGDAMSQKSKKIVSKREYTKAAGKRLILITLSLALFLAALCVDNGKTLSYMLSTYPRNPYLKIIASSGVVVFCDMLISLGVGWAGIRIFKKARQIDPGLPRTCANIAHLPAAESLVRASEPPVLSQQSVLLRPAAGTQDRHEEQLLRPS